VDGPGMSILNATKYIKIWECGGTGTFPHEGKSFWMVVF